MRPTPKPVHSMPVGRRDFTNAMVSGVDGMPYFVPCTSDAIAGICSRFDDSYWLKKDKSGGFPEEFYKAIADAGWLIPMGPPS